MKWCFFEKIETCLPACVFLFLLRIPDDADQRSGLMPITHSERCRSVIPGDADHSFRGDPDQFDQDRRKSDHDARKGDRDPPERFPQGEMTLDITEGKLF